MPIVTYLGDGVYIEPDGFGICLRANDHREAYATDNIYLEPKVLKALMEYSERILSTKEVMPHEGNVRGFIDNSINPSPLYNSE